MHFFDKKIMKFKKQYIKSVKVGGNAFAHKYLFIQFNGNAKVAQTPRSDFHLYDDPLNYSFASGWRCLVFELYIFILIKIESLVGWYGSAQVESKGLRLDHSPDTYAYVVIYIVKYTYIIHIYFF